MPEPRECALCDRVWAFFGIALAVGFLYISVDILTGGKITSAIAGGQEVTDDKS